MFLCWAAMQEAAFIQTPLSVNTDNNIWLVLLFHRLWHSKSSHVPVLGILFFYLMVLYTFRLKKKKHMKSENSPIHYLRGYKVVKMSSILTSYDTEIVLTHSCINKSNRTLQCYYYCSFTEAYFWKQDLLWSILEWEMSTFKEYESSYTHRPNCHKVGSSLLP